MNKPTSHPVFATTHWSVVLKAREGDCTAANQALEELCRTYWYPLYAYVRRHGYGPEDAEDLTQSFFARLLGHRYLALANSKRGRFRTFLLTSLNHHLANEHARAGRQKRGGHVRPVSWDELEAEGRYAAEPVEVETPEMIFERRWALTLVEQALTRLREEYAAGGRALLYDSLKPFVWGDKNTATNAELGAALGMSEEAAKKAVQRLRRRFGEALRCEIAQTITAAEDVEDERRYLLRLLCG